MKYRLIIFDSDGTLANTLPQLGVLLDRLADRHGFKKVDPQEAERRRDLHGHELLRALGIPLWKLPRIVSEVRSLMAERIDDFSLFVGVDEMLRRLVSGGASLAVVSSNSAGNVQRILGPANVALIEHFACGVAMFGKATRLRGVLRASRIAAPEAIYIGDEIRDGEAARKAGIAFGAVGWGQCRLEALRSHGADQVFATVSEIVEKLANLEAPRAR